MVSWPGVAFGPAVRGNIKLPSFLSPVLLAKAAHLVLTGNGPKGVVQWALQGHAPLDLTP
jgi:hypothetical protein